MADSTINNIPVSFADLVMPHVGNWRADVVAIADQPLSGRQDLVVLGITYKGSVYVDPEKQQPASALYAGVASARIVGGAGGLTKTMTAIAYDNGATVAQVLGGTGATTGNLLDVAGEKLSLTIDPSLLAQFLPQWSWYPGQIDALLGQLAEYLHVLWRVLPDGTIWLGQDRAAPAPQTDLILVDVQPQDGLMVITAEQCAWQVGQTFESLPIRQIEHKIEGAGARSIITYGPGPSAALLALFARWLRRFGWDFARPQPGVVSMQNPDGTLQVQLDGGQYPPLRSVAIDTGLPQTTVKVASGSRVLVEWRTGNPTQPVVTAWGASTATEINIAGGARGFARFNDTVNVGSFSVTLVSGFVAAVNWTPPGGGVPIPFAVAPLVTPVTGVINSASPVVKTG